MSLDSGLINDEGDVGKFSQLEHLQHISVQVRLRHLDSDVEHPDVVEGQLAVIAAKNVQLTFHYVGSVPTAWPRPEITRLHLLPMILLNVENMHIVHPVCAVVPPEVVNL